MKRNQGKLYYLVNFMPEVKHFIHLKEGVKGIETTQKWSSYSILNNSFHCFLTISYLISGRRVTSSRNKWGCAILTKKVTPKNPGTCLKLRPKNPGIRNARLSVYMRKLTTQIRKPLISTPHFSFTFVL